eukprot:scaffold5382_cov116-Skeletonema_marinoi.AAC.2
MTQEVPNAYLTGYQVLGIYPAVRTQPEIRMVSPSVPLGWDRLVIEKNLDCLKLLKRRPCFSVPASIAGIITASFVSPACTDRCAPADLGRGAPRRPFGSRERGASTAPFTEI